MTSDDFDLFGEYIDDPDEESIVDEKDGYSLIQEVADTDYLYTVIDENGEVISRWHSPADCLDMTTTEYKRSSTYRIFNAAVIENEKQVAIDKAIEKEVNRKDTYYSPKYSDSYSDDDSDMDSWFSNFMNNHSSNSYNYSFNTSARKAGYLDKLNKSDTLVIHRNDPTTTMLKQVYEGKGWDVLHDDYVDKNELHELLKSHDKIVLLGHGSSYGLMGGNIGPEEAPYLKDKKLFVIWCNADAYFKNHGIGKGCFISGNMPSDSDEASWVGFHVSEPYMNENITYWCKLCGEVCERALNGDAIGAVNYVRDKYWNKYGQGYNVNDVSDDSKIKQDYPDEVRITKYNWVRTKVQD